MRRGDTIFFDRPPLVLAAGAVGGKKESEGPLAAAFDLLFEENTLGEPSWERSETRLQRHCLELTLKKARCRPEQLDLVLGGDLQNQCTATGYHMAAVDAPFAGLYGACSTMAEALGLAACLAAGGCVGLAAALASSHFCAAERQFRTPLGYGAKRTPTAQWTATAAGCCLVAPAGAARQGERPAASVAAVTFGRVRDWQIKDITNMGAAMAPAAAETILRYLADSGAEPGDFDAVFTGDLGLVGSRLLLGLLAGEGVALGNHSDCGLLLYDREKQPVGAGGSGAGCSAAVLCGRVLPALRRGRMKRVLFLSTGALMSQLTAQQGMTIPGVAHLVELQGREEA